MPLPQLALARPPPGCAGARTLSHEQLCGLAWDEGAALACARLDAPPLWLADGDLLVVRDRLHPPPLLAQPPRVLHTSPGGGRRGGAAGKGSIRFSDAAPDVAEAPRASFAPGLHIRTHMWN